MDASSDGHEEVPDGMGEGDAAIAFEEDHAQAVEESTGHQLREAVPVGLGASREAGLSDGHGVPVLSPPLHQDQKRGPSCRVQAGPSLRLLLHPPLQQGSGNPATWLCWEDFNATEPEQQEMHVVSAGNPNNLQNRAGPRHKG